MNIKERAYQIASVNMKNKCSPAELEDFAEALVAELAKENKPVYAFRRKGLDYFCTCDERRHKELAQKPTLFEVNVLYTLPPTADDELRRRLLVKSGMPTVQRHSAHQAEI